MPSPDQQDIGFLRNLYDFSFSKFVTTKIIKTLYVIITIVYSILAVLFFIAALARGGIGIVFALVVVPIAYILYLALARVGLEVIAVIFRIAEHARDVRDALVAGPATASAAGAGLGGVSPQPSWGAPPPVAPSGTTAP